MPADPCVSATLDAEDIAYLDKIKAAGNLEHSCCHRHMVRELIRLAAAGVALPHGDRPVGGLTVRELMSAMGLSSPEQVAAAQAEEEQREADRIKAYREMMADMRGVRSGTLHHIKTAEDLRSTLRALQRAYENPPHADLLFLAAWVEPETGVATSTGTGGKVAN